MTEERRKNAERVKTSLPVRWGIDAGCPRHGKITSLSVGGCLLEAQVEPLFGKTVFITFVLPTGHLMALRGEVIYYLRTVGFAIQFEELSGEDEETIRQLVLYYREMSDSPELPPLLTRKLSDD